MGGICAGADAQTLEKLASYGENIGLAFQLADDLLDESATVEELGKDIGSDKACGKMTWPAVHGIEKTAADMRGMETAALAALQ
jgi:geranylgeranyl diphosphate synthase type II